MPPPPAFFRSMALPESPGAIPEMLCMGLGTAGAFAFCFVLEKVSSGADGSILARRLGFPSCLRTLGSGLAC